LNIVIITRRELTTFFLSPIAYVAGAIFLFVTGLFFYFTVAVDGQAGLGQVFSIMAVMLLLLAPILTMRLLAAETQSGTLELLFTLPIRNAEIVVGKFMAAFLFFLAILTPTALYVFILTWFGSPYLPAIIVGYMGLILLAAMLLSIGLLASAIAANQFVAATATIVTVAAVWIIGSLGLPYTDTPGAGFGYLTIQEHLTYFMVGLINVTDIIYFISITVAALFLTTRVLELRRWH